MIFVITDEACLLSPSQIASDENYLHCMEKIVMILRLAEK